MAKVTVCIFLILGSFLQMLKSQKIDDWNEIKVDERLFSLDSVLDDLNYLGNTDSLLQLSSIGSSPFVVDFRVYHDVEFWSSQLIPMTRFTFDGKVWARESRAYCFCTFDTASFDKNALYEIYNHLPYQEDEYHVWSEREVLSKQAADSLKLLLIKLIDIHIQDYKDILNKYFEAYWSGDSAMAEATAESAQVMISPALGLHYFLKVNNGYLYQKTWIPCLRARLLVYATLEEMICEVEHLYFGLRKDIRNFK